MALISIKFHSMLSKVLLNTIYIILCRKYYSVSLILSGKLYYIYLIIITDHNIMKNHFPERERESGMDHSE